MSRKNKLNAEEKVRIAEDCIEGRISQAEAARRVGVDESSIRAWIAKYKSEGSYGLWQTEKNRVYSEELKLQAVTEYLAGSESLREICKKYRIRAKTQRRAWIKVYNSGRNFKKMSGGSYQIPGQLPERVFLGQEIPGAGRGRTGGSSRPADSAAGASDRGREAADRERSVKA